MTDELTIQGVNPQMQQVQKKNNTVPYTLGGAAVGATAGYFINNAVQSKANWEDLVKEVKDTTDFSTKAEPATWNSLKEKANEVAKLQEQLKNLPEKTLPDNAQEVTDLKAAKENYAKALEAEKNKLKNTKHITDIPDSRSFKTFIPHKRQVEYDNIRKAYQQKLQSIRNDKSGDYVKLGEYMSQGEKDYLGHVKNWMNDYNTNKAADPKLTAKKYFATEQSGKKTLIYEDVKKFYEAELAKTQNYNISNPKGNKALRSKAHELTLIQLQNMQTIADAKENIEKIKVKIEPSQLAAANAKDVDAVLIKRVGTYKNELEILQGSNNAARKNLIKQLTKDYGCTEDKLKNVLEKRIKISQKFESYYQKIDGAQKGYDAISNLFAQKRNEIVQKEVGSIIKEFRKKFSDLIGKNTQNLSESEITSKAEEALKGKQVTKILQDAENAYKTALEKNGTANTAAKEALEGQIKTATEAFEKGAKELAGKLKTGGMNKYAAMAIGGVALALAGFGIASSKKA